MRTLAACLLVLLVSAPVSATPFTWVLNGQFTNVNKNAENPLAQLFNVGQLFTLTLTMESSAQEGPVYGAIPSCGAYNPLLSMTFVSGPVSLAATKPGHDYFVYRSSGGGCDISPAGSGRIRSTFFQFQQPNTELAFTFTYFATLPTDALPTDPSIITAGLFNFYPSVLFPQDFAGGRLISAAVPEPSAVALLGLTLLGFRLRRRASQLT